MKMKIVIILLAVVGSIVAGVGAYLYTNQATDVAPIPDTAITPSTETNTMEKENDSVPVSAAPTPATAPTAAAPAQSQASATDTSEKALVIEALLKRQALLETGNLPEIRAYLAKAVSESAQAQFAATSDEDFKNIIEFLASMSITRDMLTAERTEWTFESNVARVKIHISDSERITLEARKVDGVWY